MIPGDEGLTLDDALLHRPEPVTTEQAEALAREHFGLDGTARLLTGERDANFKLTTDDGDSYVLKAAHWTEGEDVTDLQGRVLMHLAEAAPNLPVPRTVLASNGTPQVLWQQPGAPARHVRVYTFIDGVPSSEVDGDDAYHHALGVYTGRLDAALASFRHPHDSRRLSWDARRLPEVCPSELRTPELTRAIELLERTALPVLAGLPDQVIHNDLNPHNIIVTTGTVPSVAGLIDFGDMIRAPRAVEIGTAGAYHVTDLDQPLRSTTALARGFHAVNPLTARELEIVPVLVLARVALSLTINRWLAARHPEQADYLLRNTPRTEHAITALLDADLVEAGRRLAGDVLSHDLTSTEEDS